MQFVIFQNFLHKKEETIIELPDNDNVHDNKKTIDFNDYDYLIVPTNQFQQHHIIKDVSIILVNIFY